MPAPAPKPKQPTPKQPVAFAAAAVEYPLPSVRRPSVAEPVSAPVRFVEAHAAAEDALAAPSSPAPSPSPAPEDGDEYEDDFVPEDLEKNGQEIDSFFSSTMTRSRSPEEKFADSTSGFT